jgi:hypothetical protein
MPETLRATELAKLLGMGCTAIYEIAATGGVPHFRIGTMIRLDPVQIARRLRDPKFGSVLRVA